MENLQPGVSVTTDDGDLLTAGQRVVTKDGKQGAVGRVGDKADNENHGEKSTEIVLVQLDEALKHGADVDEREAEASRWVWYSPDDLRLL